MRRPLVDLPLDTFMPSEHRTSTKRPLSPGAALLSPTKRRILSAEGLYSPERKKHHTPSKQLFSELATAPPSPARRLDFAALSHPSPRKAGAKHGRDASSRPETPAPHPNDAPKLQPSPTIASGSSSDASASGSYEFPFEFPRERPLPAPLFIPREMPTFADRQSIHWPGFDVHPDTYITIPTSDTVAHSSDTMDVSDADDGKENLRPRKRAGKRTALDDGKTTKPSKTERTEKRAQEAEGVNILSMLTSSPGQKAMTPKEKQQNRRQMKHIMELEMDDEDIVDKLL